MSDATVFGRAAHEYEAARPDYPFAAVSWMLEGMPEGSRRIADVGAGTGKLTRVLTQAPDAQIVAVDPDPQMLQTLALIVPGVPTFLGTAEQLPLPGESLDAVVMGQAWHWVNPEAGSAEIGRALRPGGTLGLIWNVRDSRTEWVQRLTDVMHASAAELLIAGDGVRVAAPFAEPEHETWEWVRYVTRSTLHQMADSRSHLITASPEERERIHAAMDALFDELGFGAETQIELPYVTHAFRAKKNG